VQRKLIRFTLHGLRWTDWHDLSPYEDRCVLFHIITLFNKLIVACIMYVIDILSGRVSSLSLLSMMHIVAPWYQTRGVDFFRVLFHPTNYGAHELFNGVVRRFDEIKGLFDFHFTREQCVNRVKLSL
jgi:hypothetical protein